MAVDAKWGGIKGFVVDWPFKVIAYGDWGGLLRVSFD
jgi:hypothetical protein